jgi:hypothetical protein
MAATVHRAERTTITRQEAGTVGHVPVTVGVWVGYSSPAQPFGGAPGFHAFVTPPPSWRSAWA